MVVNSTAEFTKFHRADVATWAKFIQDKNIKIEEPVNNPSSYQLRLFNSQSGVLTTQS
jgi:hypothetical protein